MFSDVYRPMETPKGNLKLIEFSAKARSSAIWKIEWQSKIEDLQVLLRPAHTEKMFDNELKQLFLCSEMLRFWHNKKKSILGEFLGFRICASHQHSRTQKQKQPVEHSTVIILRSAVRGVNFDVYFRGFNNISSCCCCTAHLPLFHYLFFLHDCRKLPAACAISYQKSTLHYWLCDTQSQFSLRNE